MKDFYDLIIIGAGASGLMTAGALAETNKSILILERSKQSCEKVYVSGGGQCNFSNKNISSKDYVSNNSHFCKSALAGFSCQDFLHLLKEENVLWEERQEGKLFAFSGQAIRLFLLRRAQKAHTTFRFGVPFFTLEKNEKNFILRFEECEIRTKNILIATGGLSFPTLGATAIGYDIAKQFGLNIIEPQPALVSLLFSKKESLDFSNLAGLSLQAEIKHLKKHVKGGLLFTKNGLSGPAILQTSLYWQKGSPLFIDFLPQIDIASLLKTKKTNKEKKKTRAILQMFLPNRLAERFVFCLPEKKQNVALCELSDKDIALLSNLLKAYPFLPEQTAGWQKAEVTKGGVDTKELCSTTLESNKIKGLYFSGEVIDVTGKVGGFNLHWAWASGVAVAKAIASQS